MAENEVVEIFFRDSCRKKRFLEKYASNLYEPMR